MVEKQLTIWARTGYIARGIVYLVVGGLSLTAALGQGGQTTDSKGALLTILHQPFGEWALSIIVVGLLGYTVWRAIQAIADTDNHGTSGKGLFVRGGLLISAVTHLSLAIWAVSSLIGSENSTSLSSGGGFLSGAFGQWVIGILGVGFAIAGIAHIVKGWTARFERYMHIPADKRAWAKPTCRFGLIARGIVWGIISYLLIKAATTASQGEIKGMDEALQTLQTSAYGPWLLGIIAAGLFAFGVYSILEAMYRQVQMPDEIT